VAVSIICSKLLHFQQSNYERWSDFMLTTTLLFLSINKMIRDQEPHSYCIHQGKDGYHHSTWRVSQIRALIWSRIPTSCKTFSRIGVQNSRVHTHSSKTLKI
jgi:hypothetical protein